MRKNFFGLKATPQFQSIISAANAGQLLPGILSSRKLRWSGIWSCVIGLSKTPFTSNAEFSQSVASHQQPNHRFIRQFQPVRSQCNLFATKAVSPYSIKDCLQLMHGFCNRCTASATKNTHRFFLLNHNY